MRRGRLLVTGASGAGTTSLARSLCDHWSVPHADADDYLWEPSDPPHVRKRPAADRGALMGAMSAAREAWVLSGSLVGWGESVARTADAAVLVVLDPRERLRRLRAREEVRLAGRAGDPTAWADFEAWAMSYDDPTATGRSRRLHEAWLRDLGLPVLVVDSGVSTRELRDAVLAWDPGGGSHWTG